MPDARYPLEAAEFVRKNELEEARDSLARAEAAVVHAETLHAQAREAHASHRRQSLALRVREAELDRAGRTVAEMLSARAYLKRRDEEETALLSAVADCEEALRRASDHRNEAALRVGEVRAGLKALEKHRAAWMQTREKRAEDKQEAEIEDRVAAGYLQRRKGPDA